MSEHDFHLSRFDEREAQKAGTSVAVCQTIVRGYGISTIYRRSSAPGGPSWFYETLVWREGEIIADATAFGHFNAVQVTLDGRDWNDRDPYDDDDED